MRHEGYGASYDGKTLYVNASSVTVQYRLLNPPIVVDLPNDKELPPVVVLPQCRLDRVEVMEWMRQKGNDFDEILSELHSLPEEDLPCGSDLMLDSGEEYFELCSKLKLGRK